MKYQLRFEINCGMDSCAFKQKRLKKFCCFFGTKKSKPICMLFPSAKGPYTELKEANYWPLRCDTCTKTGWFISLSDGDYAPK